MKIYVINLERAAERRIAMRRQFDELGLRFEFFPGTDWRELTEEDWQEVDRDGRAREGRSPLSPGMVACHLSHRRALKRIASGPEGTTAVFEDDVALSPEIGKALDALEESSKARAFDIVFLHRNRREKPLVPLLSLEDRWRLGLVRFVDWGTQSYVVSRSGAAKFLERHPQVVHRTDHTLHAYWLNGLATAYLDPPCASHGIPELGGSILREAASVRRRRTLRGLARRVFSSCTEEFRKRESFRERTRGYPSR